VRKVKEKKELGVMKVIMTKSSAIKGVSVRVYGIKSRKRISAGGKLRKSVMQQQRQSLKSQA
jgi:hypothetical protein